MRLLVVGAGASYAEAQEAQSMSLKDKLTMLSGWPRLVIVLCFLWLFIALPVCLSVEFQCDAEFYLYVLIGWIIIWIIYGAIVWIVNGFKNKNDGLVKDTSINKIIENPIHNENELNKKQSSNFIIAAWRGEKPLWVVFWIYLNVYSIGFVIILSVLAYLHLNYLNYLDIVIVNIFINGLFIVLICYLIWLCVSIWRCARNSKYFKWPTRIFVIIYLVAVIGQFTATFFQNYNYYLERAEYYKDNDLTKERVSPEETWNWNK